MNWSDPIVVANLALVMATAALVILTCKYARATRKMADTMYKDYTARNTPLLDVIGEFTLNPRGEMGTCDATITLVNKGAAPIRIGEATVLFGSTVKFQQPEVILGVNELRSIDMGLLDVRNLAAEVVTGEEPEVVVEARYIDLDGRSVTKRFPFYPWGQGKLMEGKQ